MTEETIEAPKPVPSEIGDVFVMMDHFDDIDEGDNEALVYSLASNAEILITMLESLGVANIPSVDDLIEDFAARLTAENTPEIVV